MSAAQLPFDVVASDMDGTVLNKDHQLSARTKDVLFRLATERGVSFVFATGRHHMSVRSARDSLQQHIHGQGGITADAAEGPSSSSFEGFYLISSNGARVHSPSGELIVRHDLDPDVVQALYEHYGVPYTSRKYVGSVSPRTLFTPAAVQQSSGRMVSGGGDGTTDETSVCNPVGSECVGSFQITQEDVISTSAYTTDEWYMSSPVMSMTEMEAKFGVRPTIVQFNQHDNANVNKSVFDSFPTEGVGKLCFRCPTDHTLLERCEKEILARFGDRVSVAFSSHSTLDVMHGGVSKASALREVCDRLGKSMNSVIAFGDSMNDGAMLLAVGKGCIMENGQDRLKRELGLRCEVVGHHDADGVAEKLCAMFGL